MNASIIGQSTPSPEPAEAASPIPEQPGAGANPPPNRVDGDLARCVAGRAAEIGGRGGPEPTRYGDWEKNGRCIDF